MPRPPRRWKVLAVTGAVLVTVGGAGAATTDSIHAGAAPTAASGDPAGSPIDLPLGATSGGPAALVDPEAGTGIGAAAPGNVSEYPGASVPLGMVQFSPDTSPDRQVTTGSGYDYADANVSGFSLTHLSGPGCAIYGDIPILPVRGPVPADPDTAVQPFSHADEHSSAGNYAVKLDPASGGQDIGVQLTATTRSALAAFTFPAPPPAAGTNTAGGDELLFKVSDSANGSSASRVQVVGRDELVGSVTSGDFCGIPGNYTLHFAAQFSRPFATSGTWQNGSSGPGGSCAGTSTTSCGAWVSFLHGAQPASQTIMAKVGISFVSAAGATGNLAAEDPGWNFDKVSHAATAEWNGLLGRVAVQGGTRTSQRTFYSALYHSLLFPSVFSDDDGQYMGFDHRVHDVAAGHVQYTNISEGDIYRSEVPLLATLLPGPTSQMVQSTAQRRRPDQGPVPPPLDIADNDAGQWDGDSADPIIADAYAYGARQFNVTEALKDMVHGATVPEEGFVTERQNLPGVRGQRLGARRSPTMLTSYPYTDGGSETLEYSVDDFSISQVAAAVGDSSEAARFAKRGQSWQNLFDPATGYLAARQADGSFPSGPAFQPADPATRPRGWLSRDSRRATPSSTPGRSPRTWPGCSG